MAGNVAYLNSLIVAESRSVRIGAFSVVHPTGNEGWRSYLVSAEVKRTPGEQALLRRLSPAGK
jgi:hypothetical protein